MNIKEARSRVQSITDHIPSSRSYTNSLDHMLNTSAQEIWSMKSWLFAQQMSELKLYPDIDYSTSNATLSLSNMGRIITFSTGIKDLAYGFNHEHWEGQPIEIEGREYNIIAINSATELVLNEPYRGTTATGVTDWTIKHRFYGLPDDCGELMSFAQSDIPYAGNVVRVALNEPSLTDELYQLEHDRKSSHAEAIFHAPSLDIPSAGKIVVDPDDSVDTEAIPTGRYFEIAWSFEKAGRYGPIGEPLAFQAVSGATLYCTFTVEFYTLDDQPVAYDPTNTTYLMTPTQYQGLRKVLWYNVNINPTNGNRLGVPVWVQVVQYSNDQFRGTPLRVGWDVDQVEVLKLRSFDPSGKRYLPRTVQMIRPYPRVDLSSADYPQAVVSEGVNAPRERFNRAIIRYYKTYSPSLMEYDEITLPSEFHNLVIYKTLVNLFMKLQDTNSAAFYQQKFDRELKPLLARYISSKDFVIQKQQWNTNSGSWFHGPVRWT